LTILITGGSGKLGHALVRVYPKSSHPARELLDITNQSATIEFIHKLKPKALIHCAALTGVRECQEDKTLAWNVNVKGTANLVLSCKELHEQIYFVYISTPCVFSGEEGNYVETDTPSPKNHYALTKLVGESVVSYGGLMNWLVIRTNFVAREKWPYPKAFIDRYGTYLFADDVAKAIRTVMARRMTGTLHICGSRKMSMFELARITTPGVLPATMKDYTGPALTVDMTLQSNRIGTFDIQPPPN
jgi:dTDP-4-dehydrorhamnose reductase